MTDELEPKGESKEEVVEQVSEGVTLSPEQYAALLDRIEEAEGKASRRVLSIDELAEEGRGKPKEEKPEVPSPGFELDEREQKLVEYIFKVADASLTPALQQLETKIETVKVLREIDKLEKTAGYEDFWDYKDKIYKIASDNPNLSLKDAYHLATGKPKPKDAPEGAKKPALLTLPPRPVFGEKPGPSGKVLADKNVGKTIKSAAEKAWDETMGDKSNV